MGPLTTRRAAIGAGLGILLGSSACSSRTPEGSQLRFARLSGDISVTSGDEVTPNLIIAAPANDLVWSGIHQLVLTNDVPDGGDLVFGPGAVPLEPGTADGGLRVGTIMADIPEDVGEFDLSTVDVTINEGEAPVTYDVGRWRMHRPDEARTFSVAGDYTVSMARAAQGAFSVRGERGMDADVTGIETGTPGLTAANVEIELGKDGATDITFDLEYDDHYDLFDFSPRLVIEENGETRKEAVESILVKYLDLDREDVRRIASR